MESSNFNLKIKPSHVQLFRGNFQSLLHIHLITRKSLDEITWFNANIKMQYINPFYFNFSSSKADLENQVASNNPAVKTDL